MIRKVALISGALFVVAGATVASMVGLAMAKGDTPGALVHSLAHDAGLKCCKPPPETIGPSPCRVLAQALPEAVCPKAD